MVVITCVDEVSKLSSITFQHIKLMYYYTLQQFLVHLFVILSTGMLSAAAQEKMELHYMKMFALFHVILVIS